MHYQAQCVMYTKLASFLDNKEPIEDADIGDIPWLW